MTFDPRLFIARFTTTRRHDDEAFTRMFSQSDPPRFGTVREGWPYVAALALASLPLWRRNRLAGAATLALASGVAGFFRDPARPWPTDPDILYSPADGFVIGVDEVADAWHVGRPAHRVSIFLSLFDVHVNRSPAAGTIIAARDLGSGFFPAMDFRRSHDNRRRELAYRTGRGPLLVVQVAGLLARRIVPWVQPGQAVAAGQKLGMITFGSRTDLIVPIDAATPLVGAGRRVVGGQTPVARWR